MAPLRRAACAIGLVAVAGCAAPGAVIRGTLIPPRGAVVPSSRAGDPADGRRAGSTGALTDAVIYVDHLPAGHGQRSPSGTRAHLAIAPGGFEQREVAVARGDSVVVENRDQRWHSPFSVSAAKRFELGSIAPGRTCTLPFERCGVVQVFCRLHAEPSAIVFVAPTAVWVHPDASGTFALPPLAPGAYDVRVWHPRYGERRRHVVLPRGGLSLQLRL
jgi:plastocyanin